MPEIQGDIGQELCEQIALAGAQQKKLRITGGNSKSGFRQDHTGDPLSVLEHSGIIEYEPSELVITARAGTALKTIEHALSEQHQMLAFEPPHFSDTATLGGTIACGLSGPRRPYAGAARDFVLGANIINGNGQALSFGGRVMKNVAGYDLSRLMVGAMGTLGVITEVSLKVLPMPQQEITLQFELNTQAAIKQCSTWSGETLPVTATCIQGEKLLIRLSGSDEAIQSARQKMGGELFSDENFWDSLREQTHPYFNSKDNLWRLSVAPATAPLAIEGDWLIEWGGGQRWLKTGLDEETVRSVTRQAGGHTTLFDKITGRRYLQKLDDALLLLQKRLKQSLDPENILNPGALYPEL